MLAPLSSGPTLMSSHVRRLCSDWRRYITRRHVGTSTCQFDQFLVHTDRLRDAERVLEFMRAGGGVLVHR